jgi:hypothetical protein
VEGSATVGNKNVSATTGAGVSVGLQAGAEVGGGATYEDHKVTVGAEGEVKLLAGVDVNTSVTVNVKPVEDTAKKAVSETTKVVNDVGNDAKKTADKAGKSIKKAFKF